ncbi:MAG: ABC transporter substrate-binding protein [Lachnospiraceae bacterium]|nr:ABC transporter substrate-binding protein [Lachnospiraceae bacterium]
MKKSSRLLTIALGICLAVVLTACGGGNSGGNGGGGDDVNPQSAPEKTTFTVGICQLVQHDALDAATQGFRDAITEELGDSVIFDEQNGSGDSATCATICNGFVSNNVDLIMANATPALQAAVASTDQIPILGTSVTEYGAALGIDNFSGVCGNNVSGTSDLPPLDEQAKMIKDLFPEAKTVGIIYGNSEVNSIYQKDVMTEELTKLGLTVTSYGFTDSNDVSLVAQTACEENDVLFIPTDNKAADNADAIDAIARQTKTPIIAGEEGICAKCGVATLTIDYYQLGQATGKMAVKILLGEADVSTMAIEYDPNPVKKYNKELAELYGVTIPDDYIALD